MDLTGCNIQLHWIYLHGPPSEYSGDPEFYNATFMQYLKQHDITYKARPARRHKKKQVSSNQGTPRSSSLLAVWFLILNPVQYIAGCRAFLKSFLMQLFSKICCTEFVSWPHFNKHVSTNLPSQVYLSDSSLQPYAELMLKKSLVEPYLASSKQDTPICSVIRF
jgi:hypothetical protein